MNDLRLVNMEQENNKKGETVRDFDLILKKDVDELKEEAIFLLKKQALFVSHFYHSNLKVSININNKMKQVKIDVQECNV